MPILIFKHTVTFPKVEHECREVLEEHNSKARGHYFAAPGYNAPTVGGHKSYHITYDDIIRVVCSELGILEEQLKGVRLKRRFTDARHIIWHLSEKYVIPLTQQQQASRFEVMRHSSVSSGIKSIRELMSSTPSIRQRVNEIQAVLDKCSKMVVSCSDNPAV